MAHPAQISIEELLANCQTQRTRRSGPGGQHRNKVETAVVIEHRPTGMRAEANERRSQEQNRQVAIHRLRTKLAVEIRTVPADSPTSLWKSRIEGQRLKVSGSNADFPALLAEALDQIAAADFDVAVMADKLQVSTSQLVKLLKIEPTALAWVNSMRASRGQAAYR